MLRIFKNNRPSTADNECEPKTLRQEIKLICLKYPNRKIWPRHSKCPACRSKELFPIFKKYEFNHDACRECGLIIVNPYPPEAAISELYKGKYYTNSREFFEKPLLLAGKDMPYSAPKEVLETIIDAVSKDEARGAWLDVGGGVGAFAALIQKTRPSWTVELNEVNLQSKDIAEQIFDLTVVPRDVRELQRLNKRYDIVSSVAVLEHISDPLAFLKSYAKLVKSGGYLVTAVPHFTRLNGSVSRASSPNVIPPYHLSLFNERSLAKLMSRLPGFEAVEIAQAGSAAFNLIEHIPFGEKWDASIPNADVPFSKAMQIEPYDEEELKAMESLSKANEELADYFARTDGRLYLVAYCRKS